MPRKRPANPRPRGRPQLYRERTRSHTFQLSPAHLRLIETVADMRGCSKSSALRWLLNLKTPPEIFRTVSDEASGM